jgi:hypothetical protein
MPEGFVLGPVPARRHVRLAALMVAGVKRDESLPLRGNRILSRDRVDRAGLDARVVVDAILRIDEELVLPADAVPRRRSRLARTRSVSDVAFV